MKTSYEVTTGKKRRWPKTLLMAGIVALALIIISVLAIRRTYELNLRPLNSSQEVQKITIPLGATAEEIAHTLEDAKLIRAAWAFESGRSVRRVQATSRGARWRRSVCSRNFPRCRRIARGGVWSA